MDTNLIINFTNGGKKGSKAISNINPDKDNSTLKTFAQMLNGLTANTYVDATRVDKMSVEETPAPSGELLDPHLTWDGIDSSLVTWEGNGVCKFSDGVETDADPEIVAKNSYLSGRGFLMLESDGTYAKDWIYIHYSGPT